MTPARYDLKQRVGVVPQQVAVFNELSVRENIDYFCSLYVSDRRRRRALVDDAIAFVGLEKFEKFRPRKLSGGLLRRLNIACGIAHRPELVFFDEPTVAVDPQSRASILEGIRGLNRDGSTIVYTSHYMEEVEQLCTRVLIMDHGRSLAMGSPEELRRSISTGEKIQVDVVGDAHAALSAVRALPHVVSAALSGDVLSCACESSASNLADVLGALDEAGVSYGRVVCEPPTLNDVFLEITGRELRD